MRRVNQGFVLNNLVVNNSEVNKTVKIILSFTNKKKFLDFYFFYAVFPKISYNFSVFPPKNLSFYFNSFHAHKRHPSLSI